MSLQKPTSEGFSPYSNDSFKNFTNPIYVVIFSSVLADNPTGYLEMADKILERAKLTEGFIHFESFRQPDGHGVSLSYWTDREAIAKWKNDCEHLVAQKLGKTKWYDFYRIQIAKVEKSYVGGKEIQNKG